MLRPSGSLVRPGGIRLRSRLFSTTCSRAVRSGSFFNLSGLGASREAQYLSKEHGIPRTEYSANIHLIRSSEVDPFAPAPGATRAATEAATVATARSRKARFAHSSSLGSPTTELEAARVELLETKRALGRLQAKSKGLRTAVMVFPALFGCLFLIGYQIYHERQEILTEPWRSLSDPIEARQTVSESSGITMQRQFQSSPEEQALAESALTSFESDAQPTKSNGQRTSAISGFFWAKS